MITVAYFSPMRLLVRKRLAAPTISVKGLITAPGSRTYQIWYRNAAAFCNPETFNLSNGLQVTWGP